MQYTLCFLFAAILVACGGGTQGNEDSPLARINAEVAETCRNHGGVFGTEQTNDTLNNIQMTIYCNDRTRFFRKFDRFGLPM
jgi:hypothetical protein